MNPLDRLFLSTNLDSQLIKTNLDWNAVISDDVVGANGHSLYVFSAQSESASYELLSNFELRSHKCPVLQTGDGQIITKPKRIIAYFNENGLADTRGL